MPLTASEFLKGEQKMLERLLKKEFFVCKPCAAERELRLVREGKDEKGVCSFCGRKRYGARYEVSE